jgi:hypothetical protein
MSKWKKWSAVLAFGIIAWAIVIGAGAVLGGAIAAGFWLASMVVVAYGLWVTRGES